MTARPRIAGAVLAGGQSRRMGRDKALVEVGGRAMADLVVAAVANAGIEPVIVVGGPREGRPAVDAPQVEDRYPGDGPLGGVLTALEHFTASVAVPPAGIAVVACDLPLLDASVLDPLIDAFCRSLTGDGGRRCDVVVARAGRVHPACAVWSPTAVPRIQAAFDGGERSLHRAIAVLDAVIVDVPAAPLHNVNSPDDVPR